MAAVSADRNLLFGLLALQNGLISQGQLVAAFQAWTLDKIRSLADILVGRGDLNAVQRNLLEGLADQHLQKHGGVEKSLAAVPTNHSTRAGLAELGEPEIDATLERVARSKGGAATDAEDHDPDRTGSLAVGSTTSDGQRFRIVRPHARGGLGSVFVALDSELDREVALKQILDECADDPTSQIRFLLEAQITGGLEHPGIVPIYGLGADGDGRPYYAMRFIRGDSLKETIDQFHGEPGRVSAGSPGEPGRVSAGSRSRKTRGANATPLALRKLLRRFLDVCNAIDYAHSRGVIHRDIKPANIIVGKYGETLVVDWGLAKATGRVEPGTESGERVLVPSSAGGSAVTLPGSAMGTPAYMSPEQAEGQLDRLGRRSDVYSLGATLYCLLTGQPPFTGDVIDVIRAVQRGDFRPLRQLDPNIDPALEAICLKAMAHKPEDRYASCRALADDLERWMADEPVMAWREPFSRRARRWARRNRTAVTAVAVALVAGVVGLSAVLAVQTRANGQLSAALGRETVAKTALAASNVELIRSRAAVESRFDLAMDAVKSYTTGASEDVLLREEKFKDLRGKLLGGALAFYRRLEDELAAEVDPRSRTALARAFSEVGELTSKVGSKEEALKAHRRALDARQALAIEGGAVALADVASSHRAIGDLLRETGRRDQALVEYEKGRAVLKAAGLDGEHDERVRVEQVKLLRCVGWLLGETGRRPEGLATLREAVTAQETLAALRPNDRAIQADLPALTLDVGTLFLNEGRLDDALAEYRRSQALFARLVEADPANDRYRRDLACASENVGIVLFNQGRVAEALAAFEEHLPARRAAAKANPTAILYQADLATSLNNLGFLQTRAQQPQRALKSMDEARGILEDLSAANPTAIDLRRQLAKCLNDYGYQLSELDRISEALQIHEKAQRVRELLVQSEPTVSRYKNDLGWTLSNIGDMHMRLGRPAQAATALRRAIETLSEVPDPGPDDHFALAEFHALLGTVAGREGSGMTVAEGATELDLAMARLRYAVTAGYKDTEELRTVKWLKVLHPRPDFQAMLLDMAFPAEPFAPAR